MTDAVKTVTAVVLTVLAICAIGAAHLAPITHKRNAMITVIFKLSSMSHKHYYSAENGIAATTSQRHCHYVFNFEDGSVLTTKYENVCMSFL